MIIAFCVLALICFLFSAVNAPESYAPRFLPLGLAFCVLAVIIHLAK